MFAEIACYGQDATFNDILTTIFISSEEGVECVALRSGFMCMVGDFLDHQKCF